MRTTETGIRMIKHFEGCILHPYKDVVGVPTIGYGNTYYPNGRKVRMTDKPITSAQADELFLFVLHLFERDVNQLVKVPLQPHQFDALVSFAYNVGSDMDHDGIAEGLGDSTLLKYVNANPESQRIPGEFAKWVHAGGKVNPVLVHRRKVEATYYTTGILKF